MQKFDAGLVKGASVLGVDRVTDLLAGWARGEPLTYRTSTVVALTLDQPLTPTEGIHIVPLPLSTDELPAVLPSGDNISGSDYLGHAIVSIDTAATPALFHPESDHAKGAIDVRLSPGLRVDAIWEVLSLECNAYVETGLGWNDYGALSAFANDNGGTWGGLSHLRRSTGSQLSTSLETGVSTLRLGDGARRTLSENKVGRLFQALERADPRTRVAIARWRKSMIPLGRLTDQFIDLRIALESLFLPEQPNQEMKFRLAVSGAWLVGEAAADRRSVWDTLRKAYDMASKAVHRGKVEHDDDNVALLSDATMAPAAERFSRFPQSFVASQRGEPGCGRFRAWGPEDHAALILELSRPPLEEESTGHKVGD